MSAPEPTAAAVALDTRRFRVVTVAVVLGSAAALVIYLLRSGAGAVGPLAVAASAVFVSKLTIFGGNIANNPFDPWEMALIAWVLDLWVSCAFLTGIGSFAKLPLAGRALAEVHLRAHETLRLYPGLRRLAFWGVAVLCFLPIPGLGAIAGTLVGQLVGLTRTATFFAAALGAALAVATYASVAVLLGKGAEHWLTDPLVVFACVAGVILLCWFAWMRVKRELLRS